MHGRQYGSTGRAGGCDLYGDTAGISGSVLITKDILEKTKIIDLSADFRIKDVAVYEKWYKIEHKSPQFIGEAVYGLCEVNRDKVKNARLVANPGCYHNLFHSDGLSAGEGRADRSGYHYH